MQKPVLRSETWRLLLLLGSCDVTCLKHQVRANWNLRLHVRVHEACVSKVTEVHAIAICRIQVTSNLRNIENTIHFYTVQKSLYFTLTTSHWRLNRLLLGRTLLVAEYRTKMKSVQPVEQNRHFTFRALVRILWYSCTTYKVLFNEMFSIFEWNLIIIVSVVSEKIAILFSWSIFCNSPDTDPIWINSLSMKKIHHSLEICLFHRRIIFLWYKHSKMIAVKA
jgi:hypothetical protein